MTNADLGLPEAVEDEDMDDAFAEASFYTENATNLLYEVKFFDGFVLARPASPAFYLAIRKIDTMAFTGEFTEYGGNHAELKAYLYGQPGYEPVSIQ